MTDNTPEPGAGLPTPQQAAAAGAAPVAADASGMLQSLQAQQAAQPAEPVPAVPGAGEDGAGVPQPEAASPDPGGLHTELAGDQPGWLRGVFRQIEDRLRALEGRAPVADQE